ncbi:hypothetical protein [Chryseobacterium pennipullorum]|uniref:Uncharacterized protein n=1 Tax=Chryseobacterium pennipullorum TaxID=2258963 RepID=A0A3D9B017_9FLAO|nr:hypothetical protein [Chryseobacterium pennipullorum]REC46951.1 hypothetical protein DRF67_12035 [Chryseobacterium pennipullorum]
MVSAQEIKVAKSEAAVLFVGDTKVYSTDEDFNNQILEKKIIVKGAKIISRKSKNNNQLVLAGTKGNKDPNKNKKDLNKTFAKKKRTEILPEDKIAENKVKIYFNSSPNYFLAAQAVNKEGNISVFSGHHVPKAHFDDKDLSLKRSLHFLYINTFGDDKNESSDPYFLAVSCVRPPPYLIFIF